MRFLLNIFGVIVFRVFIAFVAFTFSNLKDIDDQEMARPPLAGNWMMQIAGLGFAGGALGGLAGATLALALVQFQPGLFGAFPIDWTDWLLSYILSIPLSWLIFGPFGSAAADLLIWVARLKRNRIFLLGGGFALAAAVTVYSILLWPQFTNWM